jgi:hypothetical protein
MAAMHSRAVVVHLIIVVRGQPIDTHFIHAQMQSPHTTSLTFATHAKVCKFAKPPGCES